MAIFICSMVYGRFETRSFVVALLCVIALFSAHRAHSDASAVAENSTPIDEIVVTAQKRVSTVQTTPISISAVSGDDLLARGVASLAALATSPKAGCPFPK